jgi:hypothetical protein
VCAVILLLTATVAFSAACAHDQVSVLPVYKYSWHALASTKQFIAVPPDACSASS